jgi:uncharacterized protein YajQ (UPF0234 family)
LVNAVDQTRRDVTTRYDLKDSKSTIEINENELVLTSDNEMHLSSVREILQSKAHRRNLSLKIFDFGQVEEVSGARVRQVVTLQQGIDSDLAKKIQKMIRSEFPKIQPRIQGESLRVGSKSKDDLQKVINFLREREDEIPVPLQFTNYR